MKSHRDAVRCGYLDTVEAEKRGCQEPALAERVCQAPPDHTIIPARVLIHPPHPHINAPPHIKPEDYDGTTDWIAYQIYFDQLAELYG